MPWISTEFAPTTPLNPTDVPFGGTGTTHWFRPDVGETGRTHEIQIPSNLHSVNQQVSWSSDGIGAFACGGFNDNAVFTRNWQLWPLSIRAPNALPDVAVTAGPGFTANTICYLRWFDALTGERSPLSGASATLVVANQTVTYSNLNLQEAPERATHIEGWESRDGSLPRLVFRRQIGVITVINAKALGALGEAETSSWTKPPRCRFGAFWHDRFVMTGDDQNPTRIYFMAIGFPERWEGLFLDMKSRKAITGMAEINGVLLVFGAKVMEVVSGWTEDDLRIDIKEPDKGLISHFALVHTDTYLWILSEEQPYLSDGSSVWPMGKDIKPTYSADFKANRKAFQFIFADHHPDEHIVRWYLGAGLNLRDYQDASGTQGYVWLVADYEPVLPLEGGGFDQPRWTYDFQFNGRACAAVMAVPGGKRGDPFSGGLVGGAVYRDGGKDHVIGSLAIEYGMDEDEEGDATLNNIMEVLTGALQFDRLGGTNMKGLRAEALSLIFNQGGTIFDDGDDDSTKHDLPWTLRLYAGELECVAPPFNVSTSSEAEAQSIPKFTHAAAGEALPVLTEVSSGLFYRMEPIYTHFFGDLAKVIGRVTKLRLTMNNPQQAKLSGFSMIATQATATREKGKFWAEE